MKIEKNDSFFRELNLFMFFSILTGALSVLFIFQNSKILFSFLSGSLLAYINILTLRREGQDLLLKVYQNVMFCMERPYQKERTLFLIKVYLRLLALGIIFYFLIAKFFLPPLFLLLGFTFVYLQIFVVIFKMWLKKRESF